MKNILIITCVLLIPISYINAQDDLKVKLKETLKPDIYIDGKKYDYEIFDLLDQSKIESMNVIKGEQAKKEYNAPNGVIVIKSIKAPQQTITVKAKSGEVIDVDKQPLYIINGKISDSETLAKLSPEDIESIEVFKGQKAIEEYNAPNGAVIIKTKK